MAWIESIDVDVVKFDFITMLGTCGDRLEAMMNTGQKVTIFTGVKDINANMLIKEIINKNSQMYENDIIRQDDINVMAKFMKSTS